MDLLERVRETVARSRAGEGVIKEQGPRFIQLWADVRVRLNFWMPVPEDDITTVFHTHDYGFTSHVLLGALYNTRAEVAPAETGKYLRYEVISGDVATEKTEFKNTGERMTVLKSWTETQSVGSVYDMDPRHWHKSRVVVPSISFLDMWDHAPLAYSALSEQNQPDYVLLDRTVKPDDLPGIWQRVDSMLAGANI